MIIIGISGKKYTGKTAVANLLVQNMQNRELYVMSFADALKDEICKALGIDRHYLEMHKANFRLIMQGWGTDYRRKLNGEHYWIEKLMQKVVCLPNDSVVVIPDVRFKNEADFIRQAGGVLWRVDRKTVRSDDTHPSECDLDNFEFDFIIHNDGTLEDLLHTVAAAMKQTVNK